MAKAKSEDDLQGFYWVEKGESAAAVRDDKQLRAASQPGRVAVKGAPTEEGWLRISNDEISSEEDLTDLEDNDLVALAPRSRVRIHEAPAVATMTLQGEQAADEGGLVRKRQGSRTPTRGGAALSAAALPEALATPAPVSCWNIKFDSNVDLVWTFVAGMMLYLLSV